MWINASFERITRDRVTQSHPTFVPTCLREPNICPIPLTVSFPTLVPALPQTLINLAKPSVPHILITHGIPTFRVDIVTRNTSLPASDIMMQRTTGRLVHFPSFYHWLSITILLFNPGSTYKILPIILLAVIAGLLLQYSARIIGFAHHRVHLGFRYWEIFSRWVHKYSFFVHPQVYLFSDSYEPVTLVYLPDRRTLGSY